MSATVLVFADRQDPHVEAVRDELDALGATALMVDRAAVHTDLGLSYAFGRRPGVSLRVGGVAAGLGQIDSVWWRVKPYDATAGEISSEAAEFADREWKRALEALPALLTGARWMNPREAMRQARSKPLQLALADECGLRIPETLISNEPERIRSFVSAAPDGAVYKSLSWFFAPPNQTIYTTAVGLEDVRDGGGMRLAPGIFQHRLEKSHEVRATVVGDEIHAVAIDSQAHPEARLDWRRAQQELHYEKTTLPGQVADGLRMLTRKLGLVFGAHDLVVTPEGEHVFLEVNSGGQWLWLERHAGVPITEAVAGWLSGKA